MPYLIAYEESAAKQPETNELVVVHKEDITQLIKAREVVTRISTVNMMSRQQLSRGVVNNDRVEL